MPTLTQDFDITSPGQASKPIVITYTDAVGIDPATVTVHNISVIGPDGTPLVVTRAVPAVIQQSVLQVTYTVAKADGTNFTASDNGTYTVNIDPPLGIGGECWRCSCRRRAELGHIPG